MMKDLIVAVKKRLEEQVTELGWVAVNVGQMTVENPQVAYPCALLDISEGVFSDNSCGIQMGEVTLDVDMFFAEQAGGQYEMMDKVYLALQGFSGDTFTSLTRTRIGSDKEYYPRCFRMQFACNVRDESAKTVWTKVPLRPVKE